MKPAPPVIIMFLTSGFGSYLVLPMRTGASFHTPKSSKNLFAPASEAVEAIFNTLSAIAPKVVGQGGMGIWMQAGMRLTSVSCHCCGGVFGRNEVCKNIYWTILGFLVEIFCTSGGECTSK